MFFLAPPRAPVLTPIPVPVLTPVRDVEVRVTRGDMRRGVAWSATECPLALALQRAFPGKLVTVYGADFALGYTPQDLPGRATAFAGFYDITRGLSGRIWPEFTFTVRSN